METLAQKVKRYTGTLGFVLDETEIGTIIKALEHYQEVRGHVVSPTPPAQSEPAEQRSENKGGSGDRAAVAARSGIPLNEGGSIPPASTTPPAQSEGELPLLPFSNKTIYEAGEAKAVAWRYQRDTESPWRVTEAEAVALLAKLWALTYRHVADPFAQEIADFLKDRKHG